MSGLSPGIQGLAEVNIVTSSANNETLCGFRPRKSSGCLFTRSKVLWLVLERACACPAPSLEARADMPKRCKVLLRQADFARALLLLAVEPFVTAASPRFILCTDSSASPAEPLFIL
jgi:hypothetical protein